MKITICVIGLCLVAMATAGAYGGAGKSPKKYNYGYNGDHSFDYKGNHGYEGNHGYQKGRAAVIIVLLVKL